MEPDTEPELPEEDERGPDRRKLDALRMAALSGSDLESIPPPQPLIEGILFRGTLAALFGPPGVGKSFLAMSWALSIAAGTDWLGRKVHGGPILYVAAEGTSGLALRRRAWMKHEGVDVIHADT